MTYNEKRSKTKVMIIGAIEFLVTGMIFLSLFILFDVLEQLSTLLGQRLLPADIAVVGMLFAVVWYGVMFVVPFAVRCFAGFRTAMTVITAISLALGVVAVILSAVGVLNALYFMSALLFIVWRLFVLFAYREAADAEKAARGGTCSSSEYIRCVDISTGKRELVYKLIVAILSFVNVVYCEYVAIHDYISPFAAENALLKVDWVDRFLTCLIILCVIIGLAWLMLFVVFPLVFHCFSDFKNIITVCLSVGIAANVLCMLLYILSADYVFINGTVFVVSNPLNLLVNLLSTAWSGAIIFAYRNAADNEECAA